MRWLRQKIGLLKSMIIYDYKPFNRAKMIRFYSYFIRKGDVCFDIGAHTGNRTSAWLKMGSVVVSAEPHPQLARILEKRFKSNPNFILINKAIGSKSGEATLMISLLNPAVSTLSPAWVRTIKDFEPSATWNEQIKVSVTTLDTLIDNFGIPVFCKIDVEGFEEEVFKGLSIPLKALSFEFFPTTPLRTINCIERMQELGYYKYNWSFTESFNFVSKKWMSKEEMAYSILNYKGRKSGDIYAILQ